MKQTVNTTNYLADCIEKWMKTNQEQGNIVEFYGAFWVINPDKDFEMEDGRMFAYGSKDTLVISLQEMAKNITDEKEDFINW